MKLKTLALCNLGVILLLGSFFSPMTRVYWDMLDIGCFKLLNTTLEGHPKWQLFWALVNHKLTDWIEDFVFITFFILAIRAVPKNLRVQKVAQFLFLVLYAATIIYFVNRVLFREHFDIPRDSPTLVVSPCVRLSDEIPWLHIKDDATSSFPGDHATTLLFFAAGYTFYTGRKLGLYAYLYAFFRIIPRLIAGAHWLTDITIGSAPIVLFFLSWAFCTPFASLATKQIETFFSLFRRKKEQDKEVVS